MTTLIKALHKTADSIEAHPGLYNWSSPTHCNCGLLVKNLLQMGTVAFDLSILTEHTEHTFAGSWASAAHAFHCELTDLPVGTIFRTIGQTGMTKQQIADLEFLENPEIRERAQLPPRTEQSLEDYSDPKAVVKYMRAMADMLEEKEIQVKPRKRSKKELELVGV